MFIEYRFIFTAVFCSAVVIMYIDHLIVFGFEGSGCWRNHPRQKILALSGLGHLQKIMLKTGQRCENHMYSDIEVLKAGSYLDFSANGILSSCIEGFEKYFPNNKNGGPKNGEPKPSNAEVKGNIFDQLIMQVNRLLYDAILFSVSVLTQSPNQPMLRRPLVEVEVVEEVEEEKEGGGKMNPRGTAVSKRLNILQFFKSLFTTLFTEADIMIFTPSTSFMI